MRDASRFSRRDGDEAFGELKRLAQLGVEVWFYQDGTQFKFGSFADNISGFVRAEMNAEFRRQIGTWTFEAMRRKAERGHVAGGQTFGYRNVRVDGHAERVIEPAEADVVRLIFQLAADGHGQKAIAKRLNAEHRPSPRAQRGRSQSWAPSSVRAILFRDLYYGQLTWNRTKKRDVFGQQHQHRRPATEWIHVPAEHLRIVVSDQDRQAAHDRLAAARAIYLRGTNGARFGRPVGSPSPYLLTNFALCGVCQNSLRVCTRSHGSKRAKFYGCSGFHDRGRSICTNSADIPMADADEIVTEALLDDLLDDAIVADAVDEAMRWLQAESQPSREDVIGREQTKLETECARLVQAIAVGGDLDDLVEALRVRKQRRQELEQQLRVFRSRPPMTDAEIRRMRLARLAQVNGVRQILREEPEHARPIIETLLVGRVTFTPTGRRSWKLEGTGTLCGLFQNNLSAGGTSPTGFEPVFWP